MVQIGILRQDEKFCIRRHFSRQATRPKRQTKIGSIFALFLHANDRQTPFVNGGRKQRHHAKGYFGFGPAVARNHTRVLGERLRQTLNLPRAVVKIDQ